MRITITIILLLGMLGLLPFNVSTAQSESNTLRIGVLKFGTVNWILKVIKEHDLDKKHGFGLDIIPLGSKNAAAVSLQGGASDMIVSDWIWVSRQRAKKKGYTFVPYSNSSGALMVKDDGGINSLHHLKSKKLGVAGGPVDKSWLYLRAYSLEHLGVDLNSVVDADFAAPPLLNELLQRNEIDAALNFWHYTARLNAIGYRQLLTVTEMLTGLGIRDSVPVLGWVFSEKWASENRETIWGFIDAVQDALGILVNDDEQWQRLRPDMNAEDDKVFLALRDTFMQGMVTCFGEEEKQAAEDAFTILARLDKKMFGDTAQLSTGTFWEASTLQACQH